MFSRLPIFSSNIKRNRKRNLFILSILIPLISWFVIFMFLPIILIAFYSFTNAHMAYSTYSFVGLKQYIKMFQTDTLLNTALFNTIKIVLFTVPLTTILSTALAMALNKVTEGQRKFFTFAYFLPSIICATAICLVWKWLYNPHYGLLNAILTSLGLQAQPFLTDKDQVLQSLSIMQIWSLMGYYAVILLSAIRGIDHSIYEAAEIDGAGELRREWYVTLPLITQNVLFVSIMATTQSFMIFTPVKIMTDGRPGTSSMVLMIHIMNKGINNSDIAYASTMSLLMMIIILTISITQWMIVNRSNRQKRIILQKGSFANGK